MLLTEGQRSDHHGAALLLPILPRARELLGDRGYDSTWFRTARIERGIAPCIPSTRSRKLPLPYDRTLYRQRHRIENAFGRLKDWRRVATRYDRCAHTFFSAICIAAFVTFWLWYRVLSLGRRSRVAGRRGRLRELARSAPRTSSSQAPGSAVLRPGAAGAGRLRRLGLHQGGLLLLRQSVHY